MFGIKHQVVYGESIVSPVSPLRSGLCGVMGFDSGLRKVSEEINLAQLWKHFPLYPGGSGLVLQDAIFSRQEVLENRHVLFECSIDEEIVFLLSFAVLHSP